MFVYGIRVSLLYRKLKLEWLNGVQRQIFNDCQLERMPNNNLSLVFAAVVYKLYLVCCPPTALQKNMEREPDVTRSFLRHLRFNSGDMNTIFECVVRKLNGQTAANGESVPWTVILKCCAHRRLFHIYSIQCHCNSISLYFSRIIHSVSMVLSRDTYGYI